MKIYLENVDTKKRESIQELHEDIQIHQLKSLIKTIHLTCSLMQLIAKSKQRQFLAYLVIKTVILIFISTKTTSLLGNLNHRVPLTIQP